MTKLAVTITVYGHVPADRYQSTLDCIQAEIEDHFHDHGLEKPVIETTTSIPERISDLM